MLGLWLGIAWLWDSAILLAAAFVAAADRALGYLRPPEGLHEVGRARLAGGLGVAALVVHILGWTSIAPTPGTAARSMRSSARVPPPSPSCSRSH